MAQASWDLGVLSGLLAELVASADEQQDRSGVTRR
jgi:hypothetical protein